QVDGAAAAGGTGTAIPLSEDASEIAETLDKILNSVISVSTTYTAASIPVNVFNRSEVLDNAYIALFQTDEALKPYWVGNIKKLKLDIYQICKTFAENGTTCIEYQNNLRLIDSLEQPAVSELDGRIKASAVSYWTNRNGYDVNDNIIPDLELPGGFDGRSVNRGGAGQQIPNFLSGDALGTVSFTNVIGGRQLFTDFNGNLIPLEWENMEMLWPSIFNSDGWSSATDYALIGGSWSVDNDKEYKAGGCFSFYDDVNTTRDSTWFSGPCLVGDIASNVLAYIRGKDVNDENIDGDRDQTRRWIFGDPLHSRPLPLNYGARSGSEGYTEETNPDIRIIAGSNDGFVRMIKNTTSSADESGEEVWAFMPSEMLKFQKELMENTPGTSGTPNHPYGVDGAVSGYVYDTDGNIDGADGDEAWIFFGMRRGGRSYYALDVTNPDTVPPVYKWKITPSTSGYGEMGYTFSQPVVRELDWGDGEGTKPVLIVGGGYDLNKDTPAIGTTDTMGNAVYIIDADTGDLVWKVSGVSNSDANTHYQSDMVDSIPSEVTAIDSDNDGNVDRVYVGDTGGSVWRLDLTGTNRADWKAEKILNVGRHYVSDLANDRRFFHAPDVVPGRDTSGIYHAVVIGSGNRAHPRQTHTNDAIFMYKDWVTSGPLTDVNFTGALTPNDLFNATNNCVQEVDVSEGCDDPSLDKLAKGWVMSLPENGEKSLAAPMTLRGRIYFSTYVPYDDTSNITSCGPGEGAGFLYDVSLKDARAMYDYDTTNNLMDGEDEITLQIEDRRRKLLSGGIPSENVYVSFRDGDDNTYSGILPSDLSPGEDLGSQQWNTYWFEKGK
ncbi:MAG: PilC/PilY family type IV pilus protein, partial [Pseudomonadota bacterium]